MRVCLIPILDMGDHYTDSELIMALNDAFAAAKIEPEQANEIIEGFRERLDDLI